MRYAHKVISITEYWLLVGLLYFLLLVLGLTCLEVTNYLSTEVHAPLMIDSATGRMRMVLYCLLGTCIGAFLMVFLSAVFRVKRNNNKGMVMVYTTSLFLLVFFSANADSKILAAICAALTLLFWVSIRWTNKLRRTQKPKHGS